MLDIQSRLYSAEQVRDLDRRAIAGGIPGYVLMQRAARASWRALTERSGLPRRLTVVCGAGNNGGDGYEIARLARAEGSLVEVIAVGGVPARGDAATAHAAWLAEGGTVGVWEGVLPPADWMVDAIFGTGLSRAPAGPALEAIAALANAHAAGTHVLAVDVPSGLDASTGACPGGCVSADLTVTFIGSKFGLWTGRGPEVSGTRIFDTLDVPRAVYDGLEPQALLQSDAEMAVLGRRDRTAHKGSSGHVLVVGGNRGMAGAALLAGRAALRVGAGLVSVATRPEHVAAMVAAQPELMVHGVEAPVDLDILMATVDVIALGPGLGQDEWARALYAHVLAAAVPLVVDADGLNLLSRLPRRRDDWVLTPHPGEAARLLQTTAAQIQAARLPSLQALQRQYGGTIVLKGAGSLVSGTPPRLCPFGNPGMAVGGSGDTLTGVVAGLRAQGLSRDAAARVAVLVHALAGDRAAAGGERGMLPSDLIDALRGVVNP